MNAYRIETVGENDTMWTKPSANSTANGAGDMIGSLPKRLAELPLQSVQWMEGANTVRRSFPEVSKDLAVYRKHLTDLGLTPDMRVGVVPDNSYAYLLLEFALIDLGCISVVFPTEEFRNRSADELAECYGLDLLLLSAREVQTCQQEDAWIGTFANLDARPLCPRKQTVACAALDADVFTLVFSSGTTGGVKCLLISRKGTEDQIRHFGKAMPFRPDDAILVALPMSIYQQRLMFYTAVWFGFDILLVETDQIFHAFKRMHPTIIAGPPMFYETVERRIQSLSLMRRASLAAVGAIAQRLPQPLRSIVQQRVFAPFHEGFGGKIRFMLSGAAPSKKSTLKLFARLGLPLFEAYGLTETGFLAWNLPGANRIGSVGRLVYEGSVEIASDGEIIAVQQHAQAIGYLGMSADEQSKVFIGDNRIATGDIGRFDSDGYLYIIGRKKEIIITQGGYKVHPQSLEKQIVEATGAERAVVFGGEDMPGIVALLVTQATTQQEQMQMAIDKLNQRLPSPARIVRSVFTNAEFNTENGLLNRNLKVDRHAVYSRFGTMMRLRK